MKIETILNALTITVAQYNLCPSHRRHATWRKMEAFRARILRMDAEKDVKYEGLKRMHETLIVHHRDNHHKAGTYPAFIPEGNDG